MRIPWGPVRPRWPAMILTECLMCLWLGGVAREGCAGRGGRAYLFNTAVNVYTGALEKRVLITGLHTVCDIFCVNCNG